MLYYLLTSLGIRTILEIILEAQNWKWLLSCSWFSFWTMKNILKLISGYGYTTLFIQKHSGLSFKNLLNCAACGSTASNPSIEAAKTSMWFWNQLELYSETLSQRTKIEKKKQCQQQYSTWNTEHYSRFEIIVIKNQVAVNFQTPPEIKIEEDK